MVHDKKLCLKIMLCAFALAPAVRADLTLLGATIPHVLHPEKPGPHNVILSQLLLNTEAPKVSLTYLPYARALRNFQARESDCLYATINNPVYFPPELVRKKLLIFSVPVNMIRLYAFTRSGERPVHTWADFEGRTIVGTKNQLRSVTQHLRPGAARYLTVFDTPKAFELLAKKRADIAMAYDMDAYLTVPNTIKPLNVPKSYPAKYEFDPAFFPIEWGELMTCWASPEAYALIDTFNDHITQLKSDGELKALFHPFK